MKVKRMGRTENWRRICLFSANKIKSSESFSKQPTQLIIEAHNLHNGDLNLSIGAGFSVNNIKGCETFWKTRLNELI